MPNQRGNWKLTDMESESEIDEHIVSESEIDGNTDYESQRDGDINESETDQVAEPEQKGQEEETGEESSRTAGVFTSRGQLVKRPKSS